VTRPRFLLPLALLGFLYGGVNVVYSWATVLALTTPHDQFISASTTTDHTFSLVPQVGTEDDQRRMAGRTAEVFWSRRNALIPLAFGNIIASTLLLLGAGRTLRKSPRSAWGRSAWQLGALLGLPCVVLAGVISFLSSRDLLAAIASASDPLSKQLRDMAPQSDPVVIGQAAMTMLFLGAVALYLQSDAVKRWVVEGAATSPS
jgi:hypothetical protein